MSHSDPGLRDSLNGLLSGGGSAVDVRQQILTSWERAAGAGMTPDDFAVPYNGEVELDSRLERAAAPIIDYLAADLAGGDTSLVLTDDHANVVDRRVLGRELESKLDRIRLAPGFSYSEDHVGTNGIGTALAERSPVFVKGGEHFADALTEMACAAMPIADPRNGQIVGIIDLTTLVTSAQSLMLPLMKRASWEIEQRLVESSPLVERLLYQHFLRVRRKAKGPIALVGEYKMMTNTAASRFLLPIERAQLWDWALRVIATSPTAASEVTLSNGSTLLAECEPVYDAQTIVGAVIRFRTGRAGASLAERPAIGGAAQATSGWQSLTATERSVAELVAQGCTNREAGAKLFLSWHTIDTHLRHIFVKLDIKSRVQLARIAPREQSALSVG